jgi:hypothetical protein
MAWTESRSGAFRARYEERDVDDAEQVLDELEILRERLRPLLGEPPEEVSVVLHDSAVALAIAQPFLPVMWSVTAPAARRYTAGWYSRGEIHALAPRYLRDRASAVPGSKEMLLRTPHALYARLAVGTANPLLPPPFTPRRLRRLLGSLWIAEGAGQLLGGQTRYARPAIARRLREGGRPAFPPKLRDATLLGGTVLDLLARERGIEAVATLALRTNPQGGGASLREAFGSPLGQVETTWRAHLERLAEDRPPAVARTRGLR